MTVGTDIRLQKILRAVETELGRDAAKVADGTAIVQDIAEQRHPPPVHEHDSVHELNLVARQASSICSTSPGVTPHGFSTSTYFPAWAARTTQSLRTTVGSGMYSALTDSWSMSSS